ncbi:MAG: response regulator [Rubrivivax sp.]|nr:MAG: response regulator [Rubrivivax sp.]
MEPMKPPLRQAPLAPRWHSPETSTVTLPSRPLPLDALQEVVTDPTLLPDTPQPAYRIALIEDNVDASDMLSTLLQLLGHKVVTAFDGASGIALVDKHRPQIVMCDIALPVSDGYEVIARLRDLYGDHMPLMIAVSGEANAERSLAAGFDHHLLKPVELETLLQVIAEHQARL